MGESVLAQLRADLFIRGQLLVQCLPLLDDYAAQYGAAGGAAVLRDQIMAELALADWAAVERVLGGREARPKVTHG